MDRVRLVRGDITKLAVDAIVNAANQRMLGGGGVDGVIHRAAGSALLEACREFPEVQPGVRCPPGESRLTPGFLLTARYVIHTVGPIWRGGTNGEDAVLGSCYRTSLQLAVANQLRTIAFPAISCGAYGFPVERAANVAYLEIGSFLGFDRTLEEIVLVAYDSDVYSALQRQAQGWRSV